MHGKYLEVRFLRNMKIKLVTSQDFYNSLTTALNM